MPIHDCCQVHEPIGHRNIGDIGAPDLVRVENRPVFQQIRPFFPIFTRYGRLRPWINGLKSHQSHQAKDPLVIDPVASSPEQLGDGAIPTGRSLHINLIDLAHQLKIEGAFRRRLIVI